MITRSEGLQNEFNEGLVGVDKANLVLLALAAGNVRLTDHGHDLLWSGDTYDALAGGILEIDHVKTQGRNVANGLVIMCGEGLRVILQAPVRNRRIALWEVWVKGTTVFDAILRFDGMIRMGPSTQVKGEGWVAQLLGEDIWREQFHTTMSARTREGQKAVDSNDDGLNNVAEMSEQERVVGGPGVKVWR